MDYRMQSPLRAPDLAVLRAGDVVYLSGTIYTARDAAHARFDRMLKAVPPTAFSRPLSTWLKPPPVMPPSHRLGSMSTTLRPCFAAVTAAITPLAVPP